MSKYMQKVGICPICENETRYDLKNEIVCQTCGLVLNSPGNYNSVSLISGSQNVPRIIKEGSGLPKHCHIISTVERVGLKMIYISWDSI